jgi:hypothetical protein
MWVYIYASFTRRSYINQEGEKSPNEVWWHQWIKSVFFQIGIVYDKIETIQTQLEYKDNPAMISGQTQLCFVLAIQFRNQSYFLMT